MAQPTGYSRQYNLTDYATNNPAAAYNAAQHDSEFDAIEVTLDGICTNLALIQRDDGYLANGSVHVDAFSTAALALIAADWTPRGNWATSTLYAIGDLVQNQSGGITTAYVCATAHTSGTLATDVAAGKWVTLGATIAGSASSISFSATGTIAATNVQSAIAEVASEALQIANNLSDVASVATTRTNLSVPSRAEIQNQSYTVSAAGGTSDALTASYTPTITALTDKMRLSVVAASANATTTPTFTPNSGTIAVRTIVKGAGAAVVAGDIAGGYAVVDLQYNATLDKWVLLNPAVSAGALPTLGGTMTGALNMSGAAINEAKGADVASGSSINLDTTTGNVVDITGTTGISTITLSEGRERLVRFTGALTITHSANIILPGAANITTVAGDYARFRGYSGSVVRMVAYQRGSSVPFGDANLIYNGTTLTAHTLTVSTGSLTVTGGTITTGAATSLSLATAGGTQVKVANAATAINWVELIGSATGAAVGVYPNGTDSNVTLNVSSRGTGSVVIYTGSSARINGIFNNVASSVNYWSFFPSATTAAVEIRTAGSDTNIASIYSTKGSGAHNFYTDNAGTPVRQVQISHTASATRYITITGSNGGNPTISTSAGSLAITAPIAASGGTHNFSRSGSGNIFAFDDGTISGNVGSDGTNFYIAANGTAALRFSTATSAEQFRVSHTASAVNYISVTGGATGNGTTLTHTGSDTNVNGNYVTKGTGAHTFYTNTTVAQFVVQHTASGVNYWSFTGSATGNRVSVTPGGSDTNVGFVLSPKGTGDFVVGLTAGGNFIVSNHPTTANAANAVLDAGTGALQRSTSSMKYKRDAVEIPVDTARDIILRCSAHAMTYASNKERCPSDDENLRWYGFGAENIAQVDRLLVDFNDGKPERVQYERFVVPLTVMVADHESRLASLEEKVLH